MRIKNSRANNSYRKYQIDNPETLNETQDKNEQQTIEHIPISNRKAYQNIYPSKRNH